MPAVTHTRSRAPGPIDTQLKQASIIPTISGLLVWYDASQESGRTHGQRITTVNDRSGNGNHLAATSNGCYYDATTFFVKPSYYFNGGDTSLTLGSRLIPLTNISIFIVMRYSGGRPIGLENDGSGTNGLAHFSNSSWVIRNAGGNGDLSITGATTNEIVSLLLGTGGARSKCNASTETTNGATAYSDAGVNFHVGSSGNNGSTFSGYIAELAIYNVKITTTERDNIHTSLNSKWGVF